MHSTPHSKQLREMVCQLRMQLSSVNLNQQTAMVTGPPLVHAAKSLRPHSEVTPPGGEHVIQLIRSGGRRLSDGVIGWDVFRILRQSIGSRLRTPAVRVLRSHDFQAQRVHAVEHPPVPLVPDDQ